MRRAVIAVESVQSTDSEYSLSTVLSTDYSYCINAIYSHMLLSLFPSFPHCFPLSFSLYITVYSFLPHTHT